MAESEKKPRTVAEPTKPGVPSVATREENDCDRENHRYYIAFLLIGGLIFLLFFPVAYKNYDKAGDLAAIFSGWIGSVVGFYFLQQNTEKAQQQTTIAVKDAAEARKEVADSAKTSVNLVGVNEFTKSKWRKRAEMYRGLYEEAETMINEMLQELDGDVGGDG